MEKNDKLCFGRGFRPVEFGTVAQIFMSQAPNEIAPEIDVTEQFRIERLGDDDDPDCAIRIRSDISMLMHAADMSKKIGGEAMRYMTERYRGKVSSAQSQIDTLNLSDDDLIRTVKSRHLQSSSELLAWSEHLTAVADELLNEYKRLQDEKQLQTTVTTIDPAIDPGSGQSVSTEP